MIKPIDYSPWIVTKGGALMSHTFFATDRRVLPAQVWARLTADCRERAIRLMAQLAFNLVAAQAESPLKESDHAVPTDRP
jgi:hypothetical protein